VALPVQMKWMKGMLPSTEGTMAATSRKEQTQQVVVAIVECLNPMNVLQLVRRMLSTAT